MAEDQCTIAEENLLVVPKTMSIVVGGEGSLSSLETAVAAAVWAGRTALIL